jgi:hypothetical protein
LSVDEIWSDQTGHVEASTAAAAIAAAAEAEEEITFDETPSEEAVAAAPSTMTDASTTKSSALFTPMNRQHLLISKWLETRATQRWTSWKPKLRENWANEWLHRQMNRLRGIAYIRTL